MAWLENPSQTNGDNLNDVRYVKLVELSETKREYLKDRINDLETNSKKINIRDLYRCLNEFKQGY
jgi:hypothetical protein